MNKDEKRKRQREGADQDSEDESSDDHLGRTCSAGLVPPTESGQEGIQILVARTLEVVIKRSLPENLDLFCGGPWQSQE